jgi:hypothetical protein
MSNQRPRDKAITSAFLIQQRIKRLSHSAPGLCVVLLLLHALLSTFYSLITPVWEAYDETGHYAYARYIAINGRLPPLGATLAGQDESHQPPLYYALVALAIRGIDTSDNVQAQFVSGNQRNIKPVPELDFPACLPGCGTALAVHVGRLTSVLISTLTVLCTYLTAATLFPRRKDIALYATALHAFWPMFLFMGGVINNDNGIALLSALTLLCAARLLHTPRDHPRTRHLYMALLAACMAGATAMKDSGIAMVLFGGLVALAVSWRDLRSHSLRVRERLSRVSMDAALLVGVFVALVAIGYVTSDGRTLRQFGIVAGMAATVGKATAEAASALNPSAAAGGGGLPQLVQSVSSVLGYWPARLYGMVVMPFIAAYTWSSIYLPRTWYAVVCALAIAVLLGLPWALRPRPTRRRVLLLGVFMLCIALAPTVRAVIGHNDKLLHGRFFLPMLGAVCLMVALAGAAAPRALPQRIQRAGKAGLLIVVMMIGLCSPLVIIRPVFLRPYMALPEKPSPPGTLHTTRPALT